MPPAVQLRRVVKTYPGVTALAGASLALASGRVHALVGENGAGKSTLLGVLAGLVAPDEGEVLLDGGPVRFGGPLDARRAGVVIVHQEVELFADLSVAENLARLEGFPRLAPGVVDRAAMLRQARAALAAVECDIDPLAPGSSLSPAKRQLVEIAGAVSSGPRVLVLDEPTSSLSADESERLFAQVRELRDRGVAVVYVSHRLDEVFALADEITVMRDGRDVWSGPASGTTREQVIRHMVGREVVATNRRSSAAGPVRLRCRGLGGDGFRDVSLEARGGEVLGLYGLIGAGRSEWAHAVFGLTKARAGEVEIDGEALSPGRARERRAAQGLAYVPEDRLRQGLCRHLSVLANAVLASLRRLALGERAAARGLVERLGVRCASIDQPIAGLSGGNQQKVVLGRWLEREPAVLLLDEPTHGVDVAAREEIYALVQADKGRAVVLISSDLVEVLGQSDRVGVFREGTLVEVLPAEQATPERVAALALPVGDKAGRDEEARRRRLPEGLGLVAFVALFFVTMHAVTGRFLTPSALADRLTDASLLGFCGLGAMVVLIAGGLDISLGAVMVLSVGVAGRMWEQGHSFAVVLPVALAIGAACGAVNAALSLLGRVHPIVVTLGTMSVYRGLAELYLRGEVKVQATQRDFLFADVLGVPLAVWAWLAVLLLTGAALRYLVLGRDAYALGGNEHAARRVGVRPWVVWPTAFALQGALAALAGLFHLGRSGQLQPTSHEERTLEAIAAAVIGGTAISGGRGNVRGVALGCLLLVSLGPACIYLDIAAEREQALAGAALFVAVLLDALGRRRAA